MVHKEEKDMLSEDEFNIPALPLTYQNNVTDVLKL